MESKDGFSLVYLYVCIWYDYMKLYVYVIVSSPFLLMFGDDCVHGTREQMMLQVDPVRFSSGAGKLMGNNFLDFLSFMDLNEVVNYYETLVFY